MKFGDYVDHRPAGHCLNFESDPECVDVWSLQVGRWCLDTTIAGLSVDWGHYVCPRLYWYNGQYSNNVPQLHLQLADNDTVPLWVWCGVVWCWVLSAVHSFHSVTLYLHTAVKMCRSHLFYHMMEFHNFNVGDPYNLGMIIIILLHLVYGIFLIFSVLFE